MRAMKKARQDLSREMDKQIDILYAASAVVWWVEYGWRTTRIMRRFQTSTEIWTECADYGVSKSMLQMLEEETGLTAKERPIRMLTVLNIKPWATPLHFRFGSGWLKGWQNICRREQLWQACFPA